MLPNGKVLKYHYTDLGVLSLVESRDPNENFVYASIQIQGSPAEGCMRFTSSTGLKSSYSFESRHYQGKFQEANVENEIQRFNAIIDGGC